MPLRINMVGRRFGRLTVIRGAGRDKLGQAIWHCQCDCGNKCIRNGGQIRRFEKLGKRQSCGCWRDELAANRRRAAATHGLTTENYPYPKLYDVWRQMIYRCENQRCKDYPAYGGRGIAICAEWRNPHEFVRWCIASGYEEGLTIERSDVNGNYEPSNCTWVPNNLQASNVRKNRVFTHNGRTLCVAEWARFLGVHNQTIRGRLRRGWTFAQIVAAAAKS
jgi:hypothetical protein